jgi:hypothetical protein
VIKQSLIVTALLSSVCALAGGMEYPQAEISNGQIQAKLYLPDAARGYYRATRFDWSGVIYSLVYNGHDFFTSWWQRSDPEVRDFVYNGDNVVAGPCSAMVGPAEEFLEALGYNEAKVGDTFIKMGIGALRKPQEPGYQRVGKYDVVDPGKWTIHTTANSIEFIQTLSHPASGYGYVYRKTIRLVGDKPEMVMEHSLKNTGANTIQNQVYNHNFVRIDNLPTGPDYMVAVPFEIKEGVTPAPQRPPGQKAEHPTGPSTPGAYVVEKDRVSYLKALQGDDHVGFPVLGFGNSASDHDIRIENRRLGVGVRIKGDRPLARVSLWSIRQVITMEPYIEISVSPGQEFHWTNTYTFYKLPK